MLNVLLTDIKNSFQKENVPFILVYVQIMTQKLLLKKQRRQLVS